MSTPPPYALLWSLVDFIFFTFTVGHARFSLQVSVDRLLGIVAVRFSYRPDTLLDARRYQSNEGNVIHILAQNTTTATLV